MPIAAIETLGARIEHVVASLGVLLVLVTLFAAEQSRSLRAELTQSGGARKRVLLFIALVSVALLAVTIAGIAGLQPLVSEAWNARDSDTTAFVLVLIWLLLFPLAFWELFLAASAAWNLGRKLLQR